MNKNTVTIKDIAGLAGVSTATVSRVFNHPEAVDMDTRESVLKTAEEHGFHLKQYKKRSVRLHHDPFLAIVVADLQNAFFQEIIESISGKLEEKGSPLFVFNSQESETKELQCLSMLEQLDVDGIFISPVTETSRLNSEMLRSFHNKGKPVILIDRDIKGIGLDGVFQDSYGASLNAVDLLIENGHKNIAHIAGPVNSMPGLERLNGYLDAMKNHNLKIREEYIFYGDFKQESGYLLTKKLIRNYPGVTAVFAANNLMAIGALKAIHEEGLSVPDDIAFISMGTLDPFDLYGNVAITQVKQPISEMGDECAKLMMERLSAKVRSRKEQPARRITFDNTLIIKGSETFPSRMR